MSTTTSSPQGRGTRSRPVPTSTKPTVEPLYYLFLFPAVVLFTLAVSLPAVLGFFYSFTNSIGFGDWEFVGLRNFIALFQDPGTVSAYSFTLLFALTTVIVVNAVAFLLALGLTSRIRFQTALRAVFVMPMVISGIIIAFVFQFLFNNTLPGIGQALGIDALSSSILVNEDLAWLAIVFVTAWNTIPTTMLIYIAGLVTIPAEVYEAGAIDGATGVQQLWRITLPLVSGYIVINTILGFKNYLNAYDIIVGLTDGGPGTATRSVAMAIIDGFEYGDYGFQMANAFVFFVISIIIAVVQLRITRGRAAF